jgi:drug/metabolite transporter (DMT)-like permease
MTVRHALGARVTALSSVALVVTWSSGFVGAELGHRADAAPLTLLGWRFTALALLLVTVALLRGMTWPTWGAWRRQIALGLLCQAAYLIAVFEGVSHGVPGGTAALVAALQPLLVATVAGRLLGEHTSGRMWLGLALGLVGVAVVVGGDAGVTDAPLWAYLLPVVGMLCLSSGTVLERRLKPPESLLETVMMQSVVTATVVMSLALIFGQATPPASLGFWRAVVWLLVLASLGGYVMYVFVTRRQGATAVSTLLYLTPPTTMLWVYLMFGTPVPLAGFVGLAVSAAGVTLVLRGRRSLERSPKVVDPGAVLVVDSVAPDVAPRVRP